MPLRLGDESISAQSGQIVRILVVVDDATMRHEVVSYFQERNMRAVPAAGRQELRRQLAGYQPNLVILDLPPGKDDGLDLLREIRSRSELPVISTTDDRSIELDCVAALELGADDCLLKPFNLRELLARVRAILRRREPSTTAPSSRQERGRCRFGGWQLDRRHRRLTAPDGSPVPLTKGEYALLIAFLDAPQRPLSRVQLLRATHVHQDVFDRTIDVQILRLRRKLEIDPSEPRIIHTERGVGYMFALPVEAA